MASKLKGYEFPARGSYAKYPWEEWTDGSVWKIEQGTDYEGKDKSMLSSLRAKAYRSGMRVRVSNPNEGTVVFQFWGGEE